MSSPDMSTPVTRGELHEALGLWAGNIEARADKRFEAIDKRFEAIDKRLDDIAIQIKASAEETLLRAREMMGGFVDDIIRRMEAMFDPHRDHPARIAKLEAVVFAPKTRRRSRKRSTKG